MKLQEYVAFCCRQKMFMALLVLVMMVEFALLSLLSGLGGVFRVQNDSASVTATSFGVPDELEDEYSTACVRDGLQGPIEPDALLTVLLSPKALGKQVFNSGGTHHLQFALEGARRLHRVNFVVMSDKCSVLSAAQRLGLATLRPTSGTGVGDLTYNYAMKRVSEIADTPFVGLANSDIIFTDKLVASLEAVLQMQQKNKWKDVFLTGVRMNIDVPEPIMPVVDEVDDATWVTFLDYVLEPSHGKLFMRNTADYFFFNRETSIDWLKLPPFLLGGRAFDNWIVAYANGNRHIESVDLTESSTAVHVNHGSGSMWKSHYTIASTFNGLVFDKNPMQGSCNTRDCNWETYADPVNQNILVRALKPNPV